MRPLPVVVVCSLALVLPVPTADAAERLGRSGRNAMVRDVAESGPGRDVKLRISKRGRVSFEATFGNRVRADNVLAVRSSIAPKWGMLAVAAVGIQGYQRTFLVKRKRGDWRALFAATRGSENLEICKLRKPATAVALDLGFSDAGTWGQRCKHKRKRTSLVRQMTGAELTSVRTRVQSGAVKPRVTDSVIGAISGCVWDGNVYVGKARGEVSKANPRWGAVDLGCWTGAGGYDLTQLLVRRSGRTGAFTGVPAHVMQSYSSYGDLCDRNRRWPIPAISRVALEFCSPFPAVIRSVFR